MEQSTQAYDSGSLISPPGHNTPPTLNAKTNQPNGHSSREQGRQNSETMDANVLSKALKDMEAAGRTRERTPGASPSRKRQRIVYGDRLVIHFQITIFSEGYYCIGSLPSHFSRKKFMPLD